MSPAKPPTNDAPPPAGPAITEPLANDRVTSAPSISPIRPPDIELAPVTTAPEAFEVVMLASVAEPENGVPAKPTSPPAAALKPPAPSPAVTWPLAVEPEITPPGASQPARPPT